MLSERRCRPIIFPTDLFSLKHPHTRTHTQNETKKTLSLGRIWLNTFKIILPQQIKNRHVDHLFREWFYTDVSQYTLGFILQDKIRSLAQCTTISIVKNVLPLAEFIVYSTVFKFFLQLSAFQSAVLLSPAFIPSQKHCHEIWMSQYVHRIIIFIL